VVRRRGREISPFSFSGGFMNRVHSHGPRDARLMVVGMAPEKHEHIDGRPFTGPSGVLLDKALHANGIHRKNVFATNISEVSLSEFGSQSLYDIPKPFLEVELQRLKREISEVNPHVILMLGDEPGHYITGRQPHGITKWRGSIVPSSIVPGFKCVNAQHPAFFIRGMWRWLTIFQEIDVKRAVQQLENRKMPIHNDVLHVGPSFRQVIDFIEHCKRSSELCLDIETVAWSRNKMGHIGCLGLGVTDAEAMSIPFSYNPGASYWSLSEEALIWKALAKLLEDPSIGKIGQNYSFDWIYLWKFGIFPASPYIDTMLLHHCLYSDWGSAEDFFGKKKQLEKPGHSLAFINSQYTLYPYYKDDGKVWAGKGDIKEWWRYNARDVVQTMKCARAMCAEAKRDGLWDFFQEYYMAQFIHTLRLEWDGTEIDVLVRAEALKTTSEEIDQLQKELDTKVGYELNVASPKQLKKLIYTEMKLPVQKHRKTGKVTLDKDAINKLAHRWQSDVLLKIQELRKLRDFKSDVLEQQLDERGHIHTHYRQGGTNGARWSSARSIMGSGTNLQNVPRKGIARKLFLP
jgi:uracil-DNA glycosylase family 4